MKPKHKMIIGSLTLLFWIVVIFYFSSQSSNASNEQSRGVLSIYERVNAIFDISDSKLFNTIEAFVFEDLLDGKYESSNAKVRKSAHFGVYFILGINASLFGWLYTKKWLIVGLLGVSLPTTIAVLDEFNQGLGDRTSLLNDVVLDSVGATMGMLVFILGLALYKFIKKRRGLVKSDV